MGDIAPTVLVQILLFLLFPLIGGYAAFKLKLPSIVGYIAGGILLGFVGKGILSGEFLSQFASVGIIFLLFTVGLEVNLESLKRFGKYTVYGGLLQIAITTVSVFILSFLFQFDLRAALLLGLAFSLSSTAIVSKIIQEKGEESSLTGNLALGILVLQDLAAIPLIILVTAMGTNGGAVEFIKALFLGTFRAAFVLICIYFVGKKVVPFVFSKVTKISRETLNLFTIFFIFVAVYVFSVLGLSAGIAAFIAGVLVGQTLQHYHIFSQIRPLRDLFTVLFFVYLGITVDIGSIIFNLPAILLFTVILTFIKFVVVFFIFTKLKFHTRSSFSLGLLLTQVGEFAFVLLTQTLNSNLIASDTYHFAIATTLFTIALSPLLIQKRNILYTRTKAFIKNRIPDLDSYLSAHFDRDTSHIDVLELSDHVVLCGYGSVGKYIGRALMLSKIPYMAVDYNYYSVEQARRAGVDIIYGDCTDIDILDYAQVDTAAVLICAVPSKSAQENIILNAKTLNKKLLIFTRVNDEDQQQRMKDLGAEVVIQPEFEASLAIVRKIFMSFNIPKEDIAGKIKRLKIEHGME